MKFTDLPSSTPQVALHDSTNPLISADVFGDIELRTIGETMGLENKSDLNKYAKEIQTLLAFAKEKTGATDLGALCNAVSDLEMRLGSPNISEKKIVQVARYAHLLISENKLRNERKKLEFRGMKK